MTNKSSSNKRIAYNTVFLYFRQIVVLFLTLYISRLVLEVLGIEDFGIYNVVGGFVAMFAFMNTSMSNGVQRFLNIDIGSSGGSNINIIFTTSVFIQTILAITFLIVSEILGIWYINNVMVIPSIRLFAVNWVFQFSILSFLFVIIQVPYVALVMAYERMNYFAIVSVIDVVCRFVAIYIMTYIHDIDYLIMYSIVILFVSVITFLMYFMYTKKKFKNIVFSKTFDRLLFNQMLSFSGWNILGSFAYMVKDQGLNLLLNLYFGPVVNAARAISYQVSSALNGFSSNIFTAFRPQLMQSYSSKEYERTKSLMFVMSKFTYYLMVFLAIPIIIEIDYILKLWLGDNIPDRTNVFTVIVILNMLVTNFNPPVSQIVHATGKMQKYQVVTSVVLIMILPISWIFLQLGFSSVSVFLVSLLVSILNQFICLLVLKDIFEYSLREYIQKVVFPCAYVSFLVFPLTFQIHNLYDQGFTRLILVTSANILFSSFAIIFVGLSRSEKKILLEKIKRW